jgi:hypothetical protein
MPGNIFSHYLIAPGNIVRYLQNRRCNGKIASPHLPGKFDAYEFYYGTNFIFICNRSHQTIRFVYLWNNHSINEAEARK